MGVRQDLLGNPDRILGGQSHPALTDRWVEHPRASGLVNSQQRGALVCVGASALSYNSASFAGSVRHGQFVNHRV
jgi:hypothetical protein